MTAFLEVWSPNGVKLVPLDGLRLTLGRAGNNDIAFPGDDTVSRLHAVFEQYPTGWAVRDLGSANGTFVNGKPIAGEQRISPGDEVRIGGCRLVLRSRDAVEPLKSTVTAAGPPALTPREREVLVALCRPILDSSPFPRPATVKELAEHFVVSEAAIKFHLGSLYAKFGLADPHGNRRRELANEALRRRAVTLADLQEQDN